MKKMKEAFGSLPKEKQQAIYNAAMEVFGQNEYKKASTDLIAAKAGISKGLLFYYFHNKKALYMKTLAYASELILKEISDEHLWQITDFFERVAYATVKKTRALNENPYLMEFSIRCFYSQREEVSDPAQSKISSTYGRRYQVYFKGMDLHKFKEDADPERIYNMLLWLTDGYLHACQMEGKTITIEDVNREFAKWTDMFKQVFYKEEYQ